MTLTVTMIPTDLRAREQWICWRYVPRPTKPKPDKVPYNARTGQEASTTDPATWSPHETAVQVRARYDGIGYVFAPEDNTTGIDLDGCRNPGTGEIADWALEILGDTQSYTEISPSGTGLHILVRGVLPPGARKRGPIEMYDQGRYFTVTGQHLDGTPTEIRPPALALDLLHAKLLPARLAPDRNGQKLRAAPVALDDAALLDRARQAANGAKFTRLYDRGDLDGYPSASEADLGLCHLLAFWTGRDVARIDCLFRASALMRDKWDERRGAETYGEQTVRRAVTGCVETYAGSTGARSIAGGAPAVDAARAPSEPTPYHFRAALPREHFVTDFIAYGAECVDAAHEHLETTGLILLATATPGVRAHLRQYPRGLPTAFYAILLGDSTRSRKSSVAGLGLDLLTDAVPECRLAEQASPEAFVEQLAQRGRDSSLWYVDEIGETLDKLHHAKYLAGLRGLLLELYEGRGYRYKRTTKRTKDGKPVLDELTIERPHLSVLGATTPALFEIITSRDVTSGFLARFAVTMPAGTPPRRGLEEPTDDLVARRAVLVQRLSAIYLWAKTADRRVQFERDALTCVDRFAVAIEQSDALANDRARAMLQRLNAMTVKVAMLTAAGRPGAVDHDALVVTVEDAAAAVQLVTRWRDYAIAVGDRVGETVLEQYLTRALRVVRAKGRCPRRAVAQLVHCSKKMLDEIEATLVDRGEIAVETIEAASGPAGRWWTVTA